MFLRNVVPNDTERFQTIGSGLKVGSFARQEWVRYDADVRLDSPMLAVEERIELEARFIEQEHRLVKIAVSFYETRSLPTTDPRRQAAVRALIWRLFSPSTVVVATGGTIAAGTLVVLLWQTTLIKEQNQYFKEQNDKLQVQIDLQRQQGNTQRRTELIASLYDRNGIAPNADSRTRAEAVKELVALERSRIPIDQHVDLERALLVDVSLVGADMAKVRLTGCTLHNADFSGANLRGADFRGAQVGSEKQNPAQLSGADVSDADFEGVDLTGVPFAKSDLRRSRLNSANLAGVLLLQADLRDAQLAEIKNWHAIEAVRGANIHGIVNAPNGFREWALERGAVEISDDALWSLVQNGG